MPKTTQVDLYIANLLPKQIAHHNAISKNQLYIPTNLQKIIEDIHFNDRRYNTVCKKHQLKLFSCVIPDIFGILTLEPVGTLGLRVVLKYASGPNNTIYECIIYDPIGKKYNPDMFEDIAAGVKSIGIYVSKEEEDDVDEDDSSYDDWEVLDCLVPDFSKFIEKSIRTAKLKNS